MSYLKPTMLAALAGLLVAMEPAVAQQMGRNGYSFPARNPSLAAQFQFQQRQLNGSGSASTAAGLAALNQYVTTYSSSSTSIGNMNTVTQILSEGSEGHVGQTTDQQSTGNQGSQADTNSTVDNSIVSTTAGSPPPPADPPPTETTTTTDAATQTTTQTTTTN